MQPVLLDSSVYITALRQRSSAVTAIRSLGKESPLWLSAVVLAELYSGARGRAVRAVERLDRDFSRIGRLLVPMLVDWREAGRALSRLSQIYDYGPRGRARLMSDALIAMSARRMGITVFTANERDFARLARIRPFRWQVVPGAAPAGP